MILLSLLWACAHDPVEAPPAPAEAPTPPVQPLVLGEADANGNPTVLIAPSGETDPKALYAACRERVEGAEKDGECTTDADCAPTGCSREVCAPKSVNVSTACDVQPCFAVLDHCGCVAGHCSWSLKSPG
jgi:eight-cysteine-cluster-containing protein